MHITHILSLYTELHTQTVYNDALTIQTNTLTIPHKHNVVDEQSNNAYKPKQNMCLNIPISIARTPYVHQIFTGSKIDQH